MDARMVGWAGVSALGLGLVLVAGGGCSVAGEEGAELEEEAAAGDGSGQEDGVAADGAAQASSCVGVRRVICHESEFNCSYGEARECDPLPRALDRVSRTSSFPISGSGHVIEDSLGEVIGTVTASSTRLNFGQRRVLNGTRKVLAFAVGTDVGARTGWINESAIGRDLSFMPTVRGRDPGGSFSTWHLVPADNSPYLDPDGNSLKVVKTCGSGRNATDYLNRNGHANLIFNLPGYSPALGSGTIDSYPNDTRIVFHRAQRQRSLDRPLYSCSSGRPVKVPGTLSFLYGRMEGASTRFGWIAMPNVRPGR